MKTAIITIYDLSNYGNRLQNYALNYALKKIENNIVVDNIMVIKKFHYKTILKSKLRFVLPKKKRDEAKKLNLYYRFNRNMKFVRKARSDKYDYFLCGSDQIWNPEFAGNKFYFAGFAPPYKRISYAASFGIDDIPDKKIREYKEYLSEMNAISVREQSGSAIVKKLTGRDVQVLVDPTLLLDKVDWQKISKKPCFDVPKKYILTYFLDDISETIDTYIGNTAKQSNLKIIRLEEKRPNEFWQKTGPAEFVWLVEYASLMLTNSFHGSVFPVLMDVPFIVFPREYNKQSMSSRIDTLLDKLRLNDRRFHNQTIDEAFCVDYSHIGGILEKEREKSVEFLKKALELK